MKRYLKTSLLIKIICIYVVIITLFYRIAYHQINYSRYDQTGVAGDGTIGEIVDGKIIKQEFQYKGDYIGTIRIKVGTYARSNTGLLHISLKETKRNHTIWTSVYDVAALEDNSLLELEIGQKLPQDTAAYSLEIMSEGCNEKNAVTIYSSSQANVHKGVLSIGNTELLSELEMNILGDKSNACGRYYWFYVTLAGICLVAFYIAQMKKENRGKESVLHSICNTIDTYKFMIKQLVSRDFKTKYKRSVLGACWSFLNPLLTMAVQYVVFSTIFRSNIENYPVYLLSASILFNFFTESVGGGLVSIVGNASLIKKVYVPKYIYPVTKVLSTLINLLISMLPLLVVILITGEKINRAYLLIPYVVLCLFLFCVGMSLILSSLMVFFRDIQFLWGIISLLWMYATPMFYPESIIPERFHFILDMNPMYHYISFFRNILLEYASPQMSEYAFCMAFSVFFCVVGAWIFRHSQKKFVLYL